MRRFAFILGIVVAVLAVLYGGWRLSRARSVQLYGGLVTRVDTDARVVALTLDDGPTSDRIVLLHVMYASRAESLRALPMIVDALRSRGYTFLTVPELMAASPE